VQKKRFVFFCRREEIQKRRFILFCKQKERLIHTIGWSLKMKVVNVDVLLPYIVLCDEKLTPKKYESDWMSRSGAPRGLNF
jgi:hypothetical protein